MWETWGVGRSVYFGDGEHGNGEGGTTEEGGNEQVGLVGKACRGALKRRIGRGRAGGEDARGDR